MMPPSVPMPESRPTTWPVRRRSASWSFTTSGVTADSSAAGTKTASAVSSRMPLAAPPRSTSPAYRTTRQGDRGGDAGEHQRRGEQAARVAAVGQPAAGPRPVRDGGQRDADDRTGHLEGDPDVRADQAQRDGLQHQHRAAGEEDQERGEPVGQRRGAATGAGGRRGTRRRTVVTAHRSRCYAARRASRSVHREMNMVRVVGGGAAAAAVGRQPVPGCQICRYQIT